MNETDDGGFPVAGIGASAGGIAALRQLFRAIPAAPGLALVVVQHLPPRHASGLVDLIRGWSSLPVAAAVDGAVMEIDHVYVADPACVVTIDGVLRVRSAPAITSSRGIDVIDSFLESLATDRGDRSIAVILSGSGSDGAAGAVAVKRAGGLVLVQEPVTCDHAGMPTSAIATGTADHVLPAADIARALVDRATGTTSVAVAADVRASFELIVGHIRRHAGLDLGSYKATPLLWRIMRRMEARQVPTLHDYERLLADDPAELEAVIAALPIHVTEFFRDPETWAALASAALDPLIAEAGGRALRVWTAGCATGEEAYTLAMLLLERAPPGERAPAFQLFATDASAAVVGRASRGEFSAAAVAPLSPERLARFFYAADGGYRVTREVRERMVFAPHDLLVDPPVSGLDVVTCRNVLIYLEPAAIERVLELLHGALRPGGYLLLGRGESVAPGSTGFTALPGHGHLYRKTGPLAPAERPAGRRADRIRQAALPALSHQAAVARYDLPSVLVDAQLHVLRVYGETGPFLRLAEGEPSQNLLDLAYPDLVAGLRIAIGDARIHQQSVTFCARRSGRDVVVRVTPLRGDDEDAPVRMLMSFEGSAAVSAPGEAASTEALRVSYEELDASREELQVVNEELKAANEQLNLGNRDLSRVNAELQQSIADLEMQGRVLSSGGVITLFLDRELRVRWFTAGVHELFPLIPADVGRRITDVTPRFDDAAFVAAVRRVIETASPSEAEVRAGTGRWFLRRIRPYLHGDVAAGVAVTFTDVTDRKAVHDALREAEARSRHLVEGIAQAFWEADATGAVVTDSPSWRACTGQSVEQRLGRGWLDAIHPEDRAAAEQTWRAAVSAGHLVDAEARLRTAAGRYRWTNVRAAPLRGDDGAVQKWVAMNIDIDARKRAELVLRASETRLTADLAGMGRLHELQARLATETDLDAALRAVVALAGDVTAAGARRSTPMVSRAGGDLGVLERLRQVLDTDGVGILFFDGAGVLVDANDAFLRMTGWSRDDVEQRRLDWRVMTPPEWVADSEVQLAQLAATGRIGPYQKDYLRRDGSRTRMVFVGAALGDGTVVEFAIDLGVPEAGAR